MAKSVSTRRFSQTVGHLLATLVALLFAAGCGNSPAAATPDSAVEGLTDAVVDVELDVAPDLVQFDFGGGDDVLQCPGGAGCACQSAVDCGSGLCVETEAGGRCATLCTLSCPEGFLCRSTATAGDPISYCAPVGVRQCAPCTTNADCNAPLSVPAECVAAGNAGSFCASSCQTSADCPNGASCAAVGSGSKVCVPAGGLAGCGCGPWATQAAASTQCHVPDGDQLCPGTRKCEAGGLSACVATPGEACVGASCKDAAEGSPCDDGDPCTQSECQNSQCVVTKDSCECKKHSDCAGKEDANLCNGTLRCNTESVPYKCEVDPATVVSCTASSTACHQTSCDPASGQCIESASPDGSSCDDDEACTVESKCAGGICGGGISTCECLTSADCAVKDDADLCNGSLYCEPASHTCKVNPATVVTCPASSNSCATNTCQSATGTCVTQNKADNTACSDGDACTEGDTCLAGSCHHGTTVCCKNDSDCVGEEDGNLCNGKLFCNKASGKCQVNPTTIVHCPTGLDTTCQHNVCEPTTGGCALAEAPTSTLCDDGNPCSGGDHCDGGSCVSNTALCPCEADADCASKEDANLCNGTLYCELTTHTCAVNPSTVVTCPFEGDNPCAPIECQPATGECAPSPVLSGACDDGDPCTAPGTCEAGVCVTGPSICQCQTSADCAVFDDGNPCNGTFFCEAGSGLCKPNLATAPVCTPSSDPCSHNACDPGTGTCKLAAANDGSQCSDGEACTKSDACAAGACKAGVLVCECVTDGDCAGKEDGNLCNGTLFCNKDGATPSCALNPASVVSCDTSLDGPCLQTACVPLTGKCVGTELSGACEDGNACTLSDVCGGGVCLPGTATVCDDGNPCTDDSCDGVSGCVFSHNTAACNDGDACTQLDSCQGGSCVGANPVVCEAQDQCHDAGVCNPADGVCSQPAKADGAGCSDGDACTTGDACQAGVCVAGAPVVCAAQDQCHDAGVCDPGTGACSNPAKSNGTGCDDGNPCTLNDACVAGTCWSATIKSCTALDQCHDAGTCDTATGLCSNPNKVDGTGCSDGDACTGGDTCHLGVCLSAGAFGCDDDNPCTDDSCSSGTGCVHTNNAVPCDDSSACTIEDTCTSSNCLGTPVACDPSYQLEACNPSKGCVTREICNGLDDDDNGVTDDVICGGAACTCFSNGSAECEPNCTDCPNLRDAAIPVDDGGVQKVVCAPDYHPWGVLPDQPNALISSNSDIVSDSQTGLEWQRLPGSATYTWDEAVAHCDNLVLDSKTDWRVPTVAELETIVNYAKKYNPSIDDDIFPGTKNGGYWTWIPRSGSVSRWYVDFMSGSLATQSPAAQLPIRCVRSGSVASQSKALQIQRWRVAPDSLTVLDTWSGLSWQRKPWTTGGSDGATDGRYTWTDANSLCEDLVLGGFSDWRLPRLRELRGLQDRWRTGHKLDPVAFPSEELPGTGAYWTSTLQLGSPSYLWTVSSTLSVGMSVAFAFGVRCVRDVVCGDNACEMSENTICAKDCECEGMAGGTSCDDGHACTEGDKCALGQCEPGGPVECDDGDVCTDDSCVESTGCVYTSDTGSCDDGNLCTDDSCVESLGCVHTSNTGGCDDGSPCTASDTCAGGTCVSGVANDCGDGNVCTDDSCNPGSGCVHVNATDGSSCGSGQTCTVGQCGPPMALVPAGTYWMGCNSAKDSYCGYYVEALPQHKVSVGAFYIGIQEVTVAEYEACVTAGVCAPATDSGQNACNWGKSGREQHPVNCVNWTHAREYCQWRGAAYDLPTEGQWELAARGDCERNGSTASDPGCAAAMRTYPWGEATANCTFAVMDGVTNNGCDTGGTWAAGSKLAGVSPYGTHDMAGNVREWVLDWYGDFGSATAIDPTGPADGSQKSVRGGAFSNAVDHVRASSRLTQDPNSASAEVGIRCVRNVP